MFEKLDDATRAIVLRSPDEARALSHPYVDSSHLLLSLVKDGDSDVALLLQCMKVNYGEAFLCAIESNRGTQYLPRHLPFVKEFPEIIHRAHGEADKFGSVDVSSMHLLRATLHSSVTGASKMVEKLGASRFGILEKTKEVLRRT